MDAMDEENALDFKALRAKFQGENILLKQPKQKPSVPEKPRALSPPQSPAHYLPAGARPCFPTTLSQTLDGKNPYAPMVVFKDDKKEGKKPLIEASVKAKEKSEGKSKVGKDKSTKQSKEKLAANGMTEPSSGKKKKKTIKDKNVTAELVPDTASQKVSTQKKKGLLGFKKSEKKELPEVPTDPILDTPSPYISGPDPLAPVTLDKTVPTLSAKTQPLEAATAPMPDYPDEGTLFALSPPFFIPPPLESPSFPEIPLEIFDIPPPEMSPIEITTPPEIEIPSLPVSVTPGHSTPTPTPTPTLSSSVPSPQLSHRSLTPHSPSPPIALIPSPLAETKAVVVNDVLDGIPAEKSPPTIPSSPKLDKAFSPLSALERAEVKSPAKRMSPADQRVFNALEKARRKTRPTSTPPLSVISSPEEPPPLTSFPLVDYQAGNLKPVNVDGINFRHSAPVCDDFPELLVVPPPPPRKPPPDLQTLGPAPEKHGRTPSIDLTAFLPPPVEYNAIELPAPLEFLEADTSMEIPEFEDTSELHAPEPSVSEWGNGDHAGSGHPYEHTSPETNYSNGLTTPVEEVDAVPPFGAMFREIPKLEKDLHVVDSSTPIFQDNQPFTASQIQDGTYEYDHSVYGDNSSNKKKTDARKRKGPPKNPYNETPQPKNEEKTKTGRFNKADKMAVEGPDEKELKKKEKQRLEKEKKELKEQKEREKREQKEREKKESEMKKKFKITGQEEAIYQAKVTVTSKARKDDLPIKSGEFVSIIKTNNCPKGKWLARDNSNNYGYIAVDHVELNIKEMMELGKKTTMSGTTSRNALMPEAGLSMGNRTSNHYPISSGSFSDDSEEWTGDEEETPTSPTEGPEPMSPQNHSRTLSMPAMGNKDFNVIHQHSHSDMTTDGPQARHEALHKLTTFFSPKPVAEEPADIPVTKTNPVLVERGTVSPPTRSSTQEVSVEPPDMILLPPPDLYADIFPVK